jgi:hypothetical protein
MQALNRWTVAKQLLEPLLNEDAVACSPHRRTYVVSDGASESYSSRHWARILVAKYARRPFVNADWVREAILAYDAGYDRDKMTWSAQASYDRGSFATLLGLRLDDDHQGVHILGVGDSLVVLDDGQELCASFPYTEPEQFRANPLLLSTLMNRNSDVLALLPSTYWRLDRNPKARLFCMTDAVGAWLLSDPDHRLPILRSLRSRIDFIRLVEGARADGSMRRDDSTLVTIG